MKIYFFRQFKQGVSSARPPPGRLTWRCPWRGGGEQADEVGGGQAHKQEPHPGLDPAVTRLYAGVLGKFRRIF